MCGIYKITNTINGKIYIGQALNLQQRITRHKNDAFNKSNSQYHSAIYQAIRKYGLENFKFEIVEECSPNQLDDKEIFYIEYFQSFGPKGYNLTPGGKTAAHIEIDNVVVDKIINRLKTSLDSYLDIANEYKVSKSAVHHINNGRCFYRNNETYPIRSPLGELARYDNNCANCGVRISRYHTYCHCCSPKIHSEDKRTVSRPQSLELAKLIVNFGFVAVGKMFGVSDSTIKKWCKQYNIPYKKQELIEWYNKQMNIPTQPVKSRTPIGEIMRSVKQIDPASNTVIATYPSVKSAAKQFAGASSTNISRVCKGQRASAYGYIWEYA